MNGIEDTIIYGILNICLLVFLSPLFMSIIKKAKAFRQGRNGPSIFQTYYNLIKLVRKETIISEHASFVTIFAPYIILSVIIGAGLAVPLVYIPESSDGIGNIILFLYLLTIAKIAIALLGLDSGSSFGGMGSSREMSLSAIFEPTTMVVFAAMAVVLRTLNIQDMVRLTSSTRFISPTLILLSVSLFILLIFETSRIPVDNPETHLELTMIHEGMILEQSGRNLAMLELSHAMKQMIFIALLIDIVIPFGISTGLSVTLIAIAIGIFILKGVAISVIIGLFESSLAKMRLFRLPQLFMMAFFFAILTIFIEVNV